MRLSKAYSSRTASITDKQNQIENDAAGCARLHEVAFTLTAKQGIAVAALCSGAGDPQGRRREPEAPDRRCRTAEREDRNVFDWFVEFAEVFGNGRGGDVVLANPPYVRQEEIEELKSTLKVRYPLVYTGTADLYCYFYARAVELPRDGGALAFISSNKWFRAGCLAPS